MIENLKIGDKVVRQYRFSSGLMSVDTFIVVAIDNGNVYVENIIKRWQSWIVRETDFVEGIFSRFQPVKRKMFKGWK